MKASELMIGDLVRCGETKVKITRIGEHSASGIELIALEPIPITEEILKANGFIGNILSTKENVIRVFMLGSDYPMYIEGDYSYSLPAPKYVHELQHALRLCGLTELADNFKIK